MRTLALVAALAVAIPSIRPPLAAQDRCGPITESTVTFGRGGAYPSNDNFVAGAVGLADFGLRWSRPSGTCVGLSVTGGWDFANEAGLLGLRGRISQPLGLGRGEAFVTLLSTSVGTGGLGRPASLGGSVGVAYWPAPWIAVVGQVDVIPTAVRSPGTFDATISRRPALSVGLRLGDVAGQVSWLVAGLAGALALLQSGAQ